MLKADSLNQTKALDEAIRKAQKYLLDRQAPDGYWVGELEADASVTAGYIPLMYFMQGRVDPTKQAKIINYIRSQQNGDGSWSTYFGGPGDLNVTVQVYFSLKLGGILASEPFMEKARSFVLSRGGVMKTNTVTKIWLAVFGQFDYRGTPSIPPEIVLLPKWFFFNIYEFASWSRETIMALTMVLNSKPVCRIPESAGINELYIEPERKRRYQVAEKGKLISWRNFFLVGDSLLKKAEKFPFKPFRRLAMRKIEKWVVEHQEVDGSWGGIMLPWVYSLMALKSIGYNLEHPIIVKGIHGLDTFIAEDAKTLRLQPAVSPIWDTAWALLALRESGVPADHPGLVKIAKWLLDHEIRVPGDWIIKNPRTEPGCWAFEFDNNFYPDIDDTAVAARALLNVHLEGEEESRKSEAVKRGQRWIKEMQSRDGGWAAFDRDNDMQILASVPYADFMTPLDPTSPDVTAHALEFVTLLESKGSSLEKAVDYLKRVQEADGSWYGRWGVNYIYGTGLALVGLKSAKVDTGQEHIRKATNWLISHQLADGGWGETCETYSNPEMRGRGPSTASQTAWALMGLIAADQQRSSSVQRGIGYLLQHQNEDGSWTETAYTGTGFPKAFYLRYDLYRIYFPLLVLSQYRELKEVSNG